MELVIRVKNITPSQALVLKTMFEDMEYLGKIGSSRYLAFMADGDGNFHPTVAFEIDEPLPDYDYQPLAESEREVWAHIYDDEHIPLEYKRQSLLKQGGVESG